MRRSQHIIASTNPAYPSYVEIWDGAASQHLKVPEPPVSDRAKNLFDILEHLIFCYGFEGQDTPDGDPLESSLEFLGRVASCWCALGGTRGEYPEYAHDGRLNRKLESTGWGAPLVP